MDHSVLTSHYPTRIFTSKLYLYVSTGYDLIPQNSTAMYTAAVVPNFFFHRGTLSLVIISHGTLWINIIYFPNIRGLGPRNINVANKIIRK